MCCGCSPTSPCVKGGGKNCSKKVFFLRLPTVQSVGLLSRGGAAVVLVNNSNIKKQTDLF